MHHPVSMATSVATGVKGVCYHNLVCKADQWDCFTLGSSGSLYLLLIVHQGREEINPFLTVSSLVLPYPSASSCPNSIRNLYRGNIPVITAQRSDTVHTLSDFHVAVPLTNSLSCEKQPNMSKTNKNTGVT